MGILKFTSALFAVAVICTPLSSIAESTTELQQGRLSAARRYLKVTDFSKMMDESIAQMALELPNKDRINFVTFMKNSLRIDGMEEEVIKIAATHFTTEELDALTGFYSSVQGQSILSKFPSYMAEVMSSIQREAFRTIQARKGKN